APIGARQRTFRERSGVLPAMFRRYSAHRTYAAGTSCEPGCVERREGRRRATPDGGQVDGRWTMARGILVPLDGSALAAAAIPYAMELAHRFDAEIVLAHIIDAEPRERETSREARARAWAEAEARLEATRLETSAGGQPVRVALDQDAPATALLDAA